ncbi:MAG: hypothetical protein PHX86_00960 [Caldisericia bacterium]|nr:hypothetical protein [Caldisericia bacterium]
MNIQKLKEVVTNQASKEAQERIDATKKDIEEQLHQFMNSLSKERERKLKDIENSYHTSVNQVQFHEDSSFKKHILHTRHDVFQDLKSQLLNAYIRSVKANASVFLRKIAPSFPSSADIYCSKELEEAIHQKTFTNLGLAESEYRFRGVDPSLKPGIAFVSGKVTCIFLLEEDVTKYIDSHQKEIGDVLFHD